MAGVHWTSHFHPSPQTYDTLENKILEWFRDIIIQFVIIQSLLCWDNNDQKAPRILAGRAFLAHIALLYGVHLHCFNSQPGPLPGMKGICSLFEAITGAVAQQCGIPSTIQWLAALLDPWVGALTPRSDFGDSGPLSNTADRHLRANRLWLEQILPGFQSLDISAVSLSNHYPPTLPNSQSVLQEAIQGGQILRIGFTHTDFESRLGLLYNVQNHLYHITKTPNSRQWYLAPSQTCNTFHAIIGVMYTQDGWDTLTAWLYPLLEPWIVPAALGGFIPCAEVVRQREQHAQTSSSKRSLAHM
ncbi:hypothetical protein C8F01DRAFT_1248670 [Mycena amicta]|nr:hypothetical protein C8F01DRAFT_1248670 [Mycena amicta]